MTKRHLTALATAAACLAAPAAAHAATVELTAGTGPANEEFLVFKAGKGERNRLTITNGKHRIAFRDPSAPLKVKKSGFKGCKVSGPHLVVCNIPAYIDFLIYLGDRSDTIRFGGNNAGTLGKTPRTEAGDAARLADVYEDLEGGNYEHAIVKGGKGADVLRGTDSRDFMDPGQGADQVDAGQGPDRILDHPDGRPDRLLGGTGLDTVDGDGSVPLKIDLAAGTFKAEQETDTLDSFERARGGIVNDKLTGTDGADGLFGDNGADTIDGKGGGDYLGGDLGTPQYGQVGKPGVDKLTGGAGDDIVDGRDQQTGKTTPTDSLVCDDGEDRIVARQDDLADPTCEFSAYGVFSGYLDFEQSVFYDVLSRVTPVSRGSDGAPTYEIACPGTGSGEEFDCTGRLTLERPPVTGSEKSPEVYGDAGFQIPPGTTAQVEVTLTPAGKAALAVPGARASVHVVAGLPDVNRPTANFGWQQVLGPP